MSRYAVLIALLAAFIALGSCGDHIPTMPTRAGKVAVDGEPQRLYRVGVWCRRMDGRGGLDLDDLFPRPVPALHRRHHRRDF